MTLRFPRAVRGLGPILAVSLGVSACARIRSTSRHEIIPAKPTRTLVIGAPSGQITARGAEVHWRQHASTLEVAVFQTQRCSEVRHEPVVRIEHVHRSPGSALYWEYGIGAAVTTVGLIALIRPEWFGAKTITSGGERVRDTSTGYRIGGVFTALGSVFLAAGVIDTVRARDRVFRANAYRISLGDETTCTHPKAAWTAQEIELAVETWHERGTTDAEGKVRFALPADLDRKASAPSPAAAPEAPPPPEPSPSPEADSEASEQADSEASEPAPVAAEAIGGTRLASEIRKATLDLPGDRQVIVDFVVPFDSAAAADHRGTAALEAVGIEQPRLPSAPAQTRP